MPIVKKSTVKKNPAPTATVKKTTPAAPVKKAAPEKTVAKKPAAVAPAKETKKTAVAAVKTTGGKKTLTGNTKNFDIKEGSQATQEQFIDKYYKKLQALGYDITKEQCKSLKKAYSETLNEVTNIASYQDVDAGIFYARRYIKSRVTEPPKARDGLKTLMTGHYELKVRKLLGDESEFKFFGNLNEDGTAFVTTDGEEISLGDDEKPVKKSVKKSVAKKPKKVVEEEVEDEEEIVEDEEVVDESEEVSEDTDEEEVEEASEDSEEEDLSDFLDDDEE